MLGVTSLQHLILLVSQLVLAKSLWPYSTLFFVAKLKTNLYITNVIQNLEN